MARIAIGGFQHETNTFAPSPADYAAFEAGGGWPGVQYGEPLFGAVAGANIPAAGAIDALYDMPRRSLTEPKMVKLCELIALKVMYTTLPITWTMTSFTFLLKFFNLVAASSAASGLRHCTVTLNGVSFVNIKNSFIWFSFRWGTAIPYLILIFLQ